MASIERIRIKGNISSSITVKGEGPISIVVPDESFTMTLTNSTSPTTIIMSKYAYDCLKNGITPVEFFDDLKLSDFIYRFDKLTASDIITWLSK